jgi:hypothetical protein
MFQKQEDDQHAANSGMFIDIFDSKNVTFPLTFLAQALSNRPLVAIKCHNFKRGCALPRRDKLYGIVECNTSR